MSFPPTPNRSGGSRRRLVRLGLVVGSLGLLAGAAVTIGQSLRTSPPGERVNALSPRLVAYGRKSPDCRACHREIYDAWMQSEHAHTHRPVDAALDREAFAGQPARTIEGVHYELGWTEGHPQFSETQPDGTAFRYTADYVLGYRPLRQYIVPVGGGRFQAAELAYDPAKRDWFDVFGTEARKPGEWGHWRGRGMNWNSMCAHCHLTEYSKHYDAATDTYASTWLEHGVGCVQCHDGLTPDHAMPGYRTSPALQKQAADRGRNEETCAPCHARNELLTAEPRPGWSYSDHFRVTLPVDPHTFYPDGQVRDEDFNWTSLLTSRMGGKAGVTCLDCHDPHSGKTRLSVRDNTLCLQCHVPDNPRGAPPIDPLAHSHHAGGSAGNQCVACHMPTTVYMQRAPRHDHGFLKPDPLLTKELKIPNACDRCHADKGVDWQIEWSDRWYGAKLENRQRARTRAMAAAQRGEHDAVDRVLPLFTTEEVPAWKATLLLVLRPWAEDASVNTAARTALHDAQPLVRSAAVQLLAARPGGHAALRPLLEDPVRLVRLDAAWALSAELDPNSKVCREFDAYLACAADQPAGQLRIAQDLVNRGRPAAAERAARKAAEWDPNSAPIFETLGLILDQLDRPEESAAALWRSAQLDPSNGNTAFEAALSFATAGKTNDALLALREAVHRAPDLHRAWYDLGLLLDQTGAAGEAVAALKRAEAIAPAVADYPYALATIFWQHGQRDEARAAARRALQIDPARADARRLLEMR